ncbi:MAG: substrate-binding domain-containing protein [Kiritimatiellae bacterium]|nr:substrate-binding domain-containing protein [Kiritimatiellia bacterium]
MKDDVPVFSVESPRPAWAQVRAHMKQCLVSGVWTPGMQLPSTKALAAQWNTHDRAVHRAMQALVKEGFLERHRPVGTFVRKRPRALKTIGIYFFGGELSHPEYRYLRAVNRCLLNRVEASGMRWEVWNDPRPMKEYGEPWPALVEAVRHGNVDAVVSPVTDVPHFNWLSKLPAPVAFSGPRSLRNSVAVDNSQLVRLAVESLARQGCRSIGLISPWPARLFEDHQTADLLVLFDTFMAEVRRRGIETSDEWIVTPDRFARPPTMTSEAWGYKAFMQVWSRPKHPEGLVVINDAESLGVTMAILETGVRVPETLRLAYHKNAEVDLFCPLPVTYVVQKADDVAAAMLELVQQQFEGKEVDQPVVGFTVQEALKEEATFGVVDAPAAMAGVR